MSIKNLLNNEIFKKIASFFIVLLMIYLSDDVWCSIDTIYPFFGALILSIVSLIYLYIHKKLPNIQIIKLYAIFILIIIISMIINKDFHGYTIFIFMGTALLIGEMLSLNRFSKAFILLMNIICITSLIGFICSQKEFGVFNFLPNAIYRFTNVKNMLFSLYIPKGYLENRNYGLFYEPGMYAVYLGFATIFALKEHSKFKYFYVVLYIVTLITTASTAGIIAFAFLIIYMIFFGDNKKIKVALIIVFLLMFIVMYVTKSYIMMELIRKFSHIGLGGSSSINSRIGSLAIGFIGFVKNPFFGVGATNSISLFHEIAFFGADRGTFCNTTAHMMASFGGVYTALFYFGLFYFSESIGYNKAQRIGIVLFIFLLLCGQHMDHTCTLYLLMLYGWRHSIQNKMVLVN